MAEHRIEQIPNTPLRDNPQQDAIWKRWLSGLQREVSASLTSGMNRTSLSAGQTLVIDSDYEIIYSQNFTNGGSITINGRMTII